MVALIGITALQGISAADDAVGEYYSAAGRKMYLNYAAKTSEINARLGKLKAEAALRRGQKEEQQVRLRTSQMKSKQKVAYASRGIMLDSHSAVNVLTTTDVMGEIDADTAKSNAVREAWGYEMEALTHKQTAALTREGADYISPWMSAGSTLLEGATSVAESYFGSKSLTQNTGGK